jgi:hypothetical protein
LILDAKKRKSQKHAKQGETHEVDAAKNQQSKTRKAVTQSASKKYY